VTVINTNVGALTARAYATKANDKMQASMERLSSGLRINGAADDAAGLAVANKMKSQMIGIKMAIRNSLDGISLVQTAESGMSEISNIILRMRELAVQMENGIYTSKDRDNAQLEVNALLQEIDKIASNTKFNDVDLLDGNYDQIIRAGNTNAETIRLRVDSLKTSDVAKIKEFASEEAIIESGQGVPAVHSTITVAYLNGFFNQSADGADGVDADGSDTDLQVQDGVLATIDTSILSSTFQEKFKRDNLGTFSLGGTNAADFTINAKTGKVTLKSTVDWDYLSGDDRPITGDGNGTSSIGEQMSLGAGGENFKTFTIIYKTREDLANSAAGHIETVNLTLKEQSGTQAETQLDDIKVETGAEATRAVETLDKALEEVSSAQAKLGAIQNRLQHNIDNLSKGAMLTEQSVGRVIDANFATETSNLSKQQILSQAATAMLAQANQSKQSVLSLLQ
jgi:flagellin